MKLVIQCVERATVSVNKKIVGEIKKGLFVLVGVSGDDNEETAEILAEKLSKMRIMADKNDRINLSVKDIGGSILAVSQFTLFADTKKGNRPSFIKAAEPKKAREIYNHFVESLRKFDIKTETGIFGEYMYIDAKLDGPVTILLDSDKKN